MNSPLEVYLAVSTAQGKSGNPGFEAWAKAWVAGNRSLASAHEAMVAAKKRGKAAQKAASRQAALAREALSHGDEERAKRAGKAARAFSEERALHRACEAAARAAWLWAKAAQERGFNRELDALEMEQEAIYQAQASIHRAVWVSEGHEAFVVATA